MIQLQDISLAFAGEPILENLSWTLTPDGSRIGLIGPNGAGKSTLLRIIAGELDVDEGRVQRGSTTVGFLRQDVQTMPQDRSVLEETLQTFGEVLHLEEKEREITAALEDADDHESEEYQTLLNRLDRVQTELNSHNAQDIRPRAKATLTGLGFDPDELDRPLGTFSGGWQMRVALAKLLLKRPDILLLDEPTNHLDIDSIDWLEDYLDGYPGTVVMVSHDRYFLDRMVSSIAELQRGRLTQYDGNYSYYLEAREERWKKWKAAYENQQEKIEEMKRFINKFRYNASRASQVQSRIKKLEKMDKIPPPPSEPDTITLRFPEAPRSGQIVLELSKFSKTYEDENGTTTVFDGADPLTIGRGDKIALIGPNGAGKSTLARILRGTEPFEGTREEGHNVTMGFFAQHQSQSLDRDQTVLESLREVAPDRTDTELRTTLGAFLFQGDDVFKKVHMLSGGEKSRLALARAIASPANFLILDEPTNHLDIRSKNVLIEALQQYSGTFVIVSHDRHFLDEVVNKVWRVGHGAVQTFHGNYSEYQWQVEHGSVELAGAEDASTTNGTPQDTDASPEPTSSSSSDASAASSTAGTPFSHLNSYQLQRKFDETEEAILEKEAAKDELEAELADPEAYNDPEIMREKTEAYNALEQELEELYATWERLADHVAAQES